MKEIDWPAPCGYSVFCDDIRKEEGGKVSLIGSYRGVLYTGTDFPTLLPKFGIYVTYSELQDVEIPPLELWVFLPGDEADLPSIKLPGPDTANAKKLGLPLQPGDQPRYTMHFPLILAPLELKEPGRIKVRMKRGDEIVRMGSLAVVKFSPEQANNPLDTN